MARAIRATEYLVSRFHAVSDDLAITVGADWRDGVNCAFEAVERVYASAYPDLETLIVVVAANFALRHSRSPFEKEGSGSQGHAPWIVPHTSLGLQWAVLLSGFGTGCYHQNFSGIENASRVASQSRDGYPRPSFVCLNIRNKGEPK